MRRLGMADGRDFDHPALAEGRRLRPHLIFRIGRSRWLRDNPTD